LEYLIAAWLEFKVFDWWTLKIDAGILGLGKPNLDYFID
jgi:hypothetical protein